MANYSIKIKKSAQKEISSIHKKDLFKIINAIQVLAKNPKGSNCKKLQNQERYRVRVGKYRILYEICDEVLVIIIVKVAHCKDVYR